MHCTLLWGIIKSEIDALLPVSKEQEGDTVAAECKIKNELGTISVVEDVITTVAGYAAVECIGIVAMASKRATDGLVELLGRENLKRGVRVALSEDSCAISLYIIVEYGVSIAAVAKNVIESVKYRVESMVGIKVDKVDVTVEGIRVN